MLSCLYCTMACVPSKSTSDAYSEQSLMMLMADGEMVLVKCLSCKCGDPSSIPQNSHFKKKQNKRSSSGQLWW